MVQFRILSGQRSGQLCSLDHFPCVIGRSSRADICLEDPGIWEKHVELRLDSSRSFLFSAFPETLVAVNGHALREGAMRNGDVVEIGAVRLQFFLRETTQKALALREGLTWVSLGVLAVAQAWLIIWLLQ